MKLAQKLAYQHLHVFSAIDAEARKNEIAQAIDQLNLKIAELSPGKSFTDVYMELVYKAQSASGAGKWPDAYNAIWNATFLINRAVESINKRLYRSWLAVTPLFTFGLIAFIHRLLDEVLAGSTSAIMDDYFPYLWAGAIGGTAAAYWGLVKHTILLDFDGQYNLWYYFKPLFGALFGLVAVLIIKAGFISMQVNAEIKNQLPLYIIAFIAGFSERFFMQLIDRVTTALFGGPAADRYTSAPGMPKVEQVTDVVPSVPKTMEEHTGTEPEHPGLP